MSRSLISVLACLAAFLTLLGPLHAQNGTGIFMSNGTVLRAGKTLQLSLNANISQFLYNPTGDHIAYVNVKDEGDKQTISVDYITACQPDPEAVTLKIFSGPIPQPSTPMDGSYRVSLLGWSGDGRYLAFRAEIESDEHTGSPSSVRYYVADTLAPAGALQSHLLPPFATPSHFFGRTMFAWSPRQDRLLLVPNYLSFTQQQAAEAAGKHVLQARGALYDLASGQMHGLQLPSTENVLGWQDGTHLLMHSFPVTDTPGFLSYDTTTDKITPLPHGATNPVVLQDVWGVSDGPNPSDANPKALGLSLEMDEHSIQYSLYDPQNGPTMPVWVIWVVKASSLKPISVLAVAVVRDVETPESEGTPPSEETPQAQWSPNGDAFAYLAQGDLFVAPLTESPLTPEEESAVGQAEITTDDKKLAGDKQLSCAEEKTAITF